MGKTRRRPPVPSHVLCWKHLWAISSEISNRQNLACLRLCSHLRALVQPAPRKTRQCRKRRLLVSHCPSLHRCVDHLQQRIPEEKTGRDMESTSRKSMPMPRLSS